jgi:hypothetical protein
MEPRLAGKDLDLFIVCPASQHASGWLLFYGW